MTIKRRIMVADDISRMPYEMHQLYERFAGKVDAVCTIPSAARTFLENNYCVTIIDPLVFTKKLSGIRDLIKLAKKASDHLVLIESGISATDLGLRLGDHYDLCHPKLYSIDQLMPQIEQWMRS